MIQIYVTIEEQEDGMRISYCAPPTKHATALEVQAHDAIHAGMQRGLAEASHGPVIRVDMPAPVKPVTGMS